MRSYVHHLGDWATHTDGLSFVEYAIYHKLIGIYYAKEQPLSGDVTYLCRILHAITPNERKAVQAVIDQFFTRESDGKLHQKRCDSELADHAQFVQAQREKIAKRWNGHSNRQSTSNNHDDLSVNSESLFSEDNKVNYPQYASERLRAVASTQSDTDGSTAGIPPVIPPLLPITNTLKTAAAAAVFAGDARARAGAASACARAAAAAGLEIPEVDPRLLALIADGATPGEFRFAAAKAVTAGKGAAWMFAAVSGMRRESAGLNGTQTAHEGPKSGSGAPYSMLPRANDPHT